MIHFLTGFRPSLSDHCRTQPSRSHHAPLWLAVLLALPMAVLAQTTQDSADLPQGQVPDRARLWKMIQQQQKTIEALQAELARQQQALHAASQNVRQQQKELEQVAEVLSEVPATDSPADTTLGGYGELHYSNLDSGNKVDFHRFVLFVGHDFSEQTRFYSELEVEHAVAGEGKKGEVELEQAFIEHRVNDRFTAKAGLMLMPVGILNETHEPDTFYGVERNPVEKNILPTTWWEAGLATEYRINPRLRADIMVSSGLNVPTSGAKAFLIRSGRQSVAKALANDGAITARLRYQPVRGLQLAATVHHQQDITQGQLGIGATLLEANAQYRHGPFGLKILAAHWQLENAVKALAPGREEQAGYYLEPSWRLGQKQNLGLFARYAVWDNAAGNDDSDTRIKQFTAGFNYWLHPQVVFKLDYQNQSGAADDDGLSLGMGYSF
jgi:predicted porin